ncbi:MAG TPA: NIPSNAP family protein [Candidatus Polarisedimenticolaceae bacterium]|nr:NIPSNAP family protein [Candidatus Polarisedimenticolaceae bacterium]
MIIDLRDYMTTPGNRDRLIERCERLFFPEQERLGATILGAFRDGDDANRFVWLRAMPDMETRKRVLTEFYTDGAMWREHRDEVNAWIADSDNVLLARPVGEIAPSATGESIVGMYARLGSARMGEDAVKTVPDTIRADGGRLLVTLAVEPVENNYPRHPIREGEQGWVWLATFAPNAVVERRLLPVPTSRLR